MKFEREVLVDLPAAICLLGLKDRGNVGHVRVCQLCVHEKADSEELRYRKPRGIDYAADFMTRALTGIEIKKHFSKINL